MPGLSLWLDASVSASLLSDGAPIANGLPVSDWGDVSGGGRGFAQSDDGARPTYSTGLQNGLAGLVFDGEDDHLIRDVWDHEPAVVLVVGSNAGSGRRAFLGMATSDPIDAPGFAFVANRSGVATTGFRVARATTADGSSATDLAADGASNASAVGLFASRSSGAALGVFHGPSVVPEASDSTASALRPISGQAVIGATASAAGIGDFLGGVLHEVLVYRRRLDDRALLALMRYLASKWGI